ncbi:MAG: hypothetical protein AAGK17_09940 [Pseudomonadota bacterium]
MIEFTEGEFTLSDGISFPGEGWIKRPNPNIHRMLDTGWKFGDYHSLAGRFRFNSEGFGQEPLALYTISTRNNITVRLNGVQVFRNFAEASDQKNTWYQPILIPLPSNLIKSGSNELVIEAYSQESLAIGRVMVGSHGALQGYYNTKYFWQVTAPSLANFTMVLVGLLAFLFWLGRRQEIELLWLAISTVLWFLRNFQYYIGETPIELNPFGMAVFTTLHIHASYFATAATAAFYFYFTQVPHRKWLIVGMFVLGFVLIAIHSSGVTTDLIVYLPTMIIVTAIAIMGFRDLVKYRDIEHGLLGFVMMAAPLASFYDLAMAVRYSGDGTATYAATFSGLFYTLAFVVSFGRRALDAFAHLRRTNILLEERVAEATADLAASERARRDLLVEQTLAGERERIMQEMHDGIGSNLITALTVARSQNLPESTIKTLSGALSDLKITVDSLEPVEGDIVTLIGNLRHRLAGDLADAGIDCKWEVGECQPIEWLDPTNALHVLRIMQEAIANVLSHSNASEMTIGCKERVHNGVNGIVTYTIDNGRGFDSVNESPGKGLSNMQARARALRGNLWSKSSAGNGCSILLWLPYIRE